MFEDRRLAHDIVEMRALLDDGSLLEVAGAAIAYQLGANVQPGRTPTSAYLPSARPDRT